MSFKNQPNKNPNETPIRIIADSTRCIRLSPRRKLNHRQRSDLDLGYNIGRRFNHHRGLRYLEYHRNKLEQCWR